MDFPPSLDFFEIPGDDQYGILASDLANQNPLAA